MSESTKYDVIIVGGGPAGSTAGYLLAKSGLKVLIIDKSIFPRQKLCGGCITDKTIKLLERVFGETISNLKRENVINFVSHHYEIFYKDKLILGKDINVPSYFVERYTYDNFFLGKARKTGAEVIEGEEVESLDTDNNLIKTSAGKTLTARFIIGADGINSTIRRVFPENKINKKVWQDNLATGLEIFISRSDARKAIKHPVLYFDYISYGYSWLFPNKDKLIAGTGGLNRKNKKQFLTSFKKFFLTLDIGEFKSDKIRGYSFPYGNFLLEPVFRNVLLVGDAAGFADPLLGEGIFYAQRSSELASLAILKVLKKEINQEKTQEEIAKAYIQLLQQYIYTELVYAKKMRDFAFKYFNKLHSLPLKVLMNMLGKKPVETIHGIRSYRWMKKQAEE